MKHALVVLGTGAFLIACGGAVAAVPAAERDEPTIESPAIDPTSPYVSSTSTPKPVPTTTEPPPQIHPPVDPQDAGIPAVCDFPGTSVTRCMTHEELVYMVEHPEWGGDQDFDAGAQPWDPNGCLPMDHVHDDCCMPAASGPVLSPDGACCYAFCAGGCC